MEKGGKSKVLVVDDDRAVGMVLAALLGQAGYDAHHVSSGEEALAALASRRIDAILSDVRMPGMDGLELLAATKKRAPDVPVVLITAHGTIPLAVEAMKAGAAEFLTKPFDRDEVVYTIGKALAAAERSARKPPEQEVYEQTDGPVIGRSPAMLDAMARLEKAAPTMATVLLRGESGTGKEVAARLVHQKSPRKNGPFVPVHCAALPDQLLESELFGYEKGAFTGAAVRKPGRVELANGGTLFLDEIGDVTPAVQVKLLRLLQEREFQRLGGTAPEKADVRFVAATHRDLEAMVRAGTFREDLFYRLNVVPITMPSLRDRRQDVEALVRRFVHELAERNGRAGLGIAADAIAALAAADWPGNVRELSNFVERLVVFAAGSTISQGDVERELSARPAAVGSSPSAPPSAPSPAPTAEGASLDARRMDAERAAVKDALNKASGNRTQAARLLGVSRRTLYNKLAELGID
jgi:DNA-binding NtrC family response regulator